MLERDSRESWEIFPFWRAERRRRWEVVLEREREKRRKGVIGQSYNSTKSGGGLDGEAPLPFPQWRCTHKWLGCVLAPPSRGGISANPHEAMIARTLAGGRTLLSLPLVPMLRECYERHISIHAYPHRPKIDGLALLLLCTD